MRASGNRQFPERPAPSAGGGMAFIVISCAAVICGALYLIGVNWNGKEKPTPGASEAGLSGPGPAVGREAPEISGEDIDGVPFKLSDYRGRVVLLDFWGHW